VKHADNEWGISLGGDYDEEEESDSKTVVVESKPEFVEVKKEQSLADLMSSMKKLQTKS
jgi:hypothetical protein